MLACLEIAVSKQEIAPRPLYYLTMTIITLSISCVVLLYVGGKPLEKKLVRFVKRKVRRPTGIFGFFSLTGIGIGATVGASIFVVVPTAIWRAGTIGVFSLLFGAVISTLLAVSYGKMFQRTQRIPEAVRQPVYIGGPSFVSLAYGKRSIAYFISRFSLWVGNTTLTAFNALMIIHFIYGYFPKCFETLGVAREYSMLGVIAILIVFVFWFIISTIYESKYKKELVVAQTLLSTIFILLLVRHILVLSERVPPSISLSEIPQDPLSLVKTFLTTAAYVYLLFFGFQEIQALGGEFKEEITVPTFKGRKKVRMYTYVPLTMLITVITCSILFLAYALAVSGTSSVESGIPGLDVALTLGSKEYVFLIIAFFIASLTTLVPSYMAASRHLIMLGEDGYFPKQLSRYAYLFTFLIMAVLTMAKEEFLIKITDFSVLISLGIIALAERRICLLQGEKPSVRSIVISVACLLIAGAFYLDSPNVFFSGIAFIYLGWALFELIKIGFGGLNLFITVLCLAMYFLSSRIASLGAPLEEAILKTMAVLMVILAIAHILNFITSPSIEKKIVNKTGSTLDLLLISVTLLAIRKIGKLLEFPVYLLKKVKDYRSKTRVQSNKYKLVELALKLEDYKEKNPELYSRLKAILEEDLEKLEKTLKT
ncbi:MAG: hypothetical protein DRJ62_05275 [Thermoprotei archaeon]|nr:MAG: hypothetical protein DRJ62_05275 [Thermoprotei archaeon]